MNDTATMTIKQTAEEFARARERHDWREIAGEWFEAPVRRWIGTLDADGEPEDDMGDAVILAVGMREFLACGTSCSSPPSAGNVRTSPRTGPSTSSDAR